MHLGRRIVAALCALLVLQLVFVGGGYACSRTGAGASMADMGMGTDAHHGPSSSNDHQKVPCRFPWAPNGCQSMVPCAPAAIAAPMQGVVDAAPPIVVVTLLSVVTPPSQTPPPELPPPRV